MNFTTTCRIYKIKPAVQGCKAVRNSWVCGVEQYQQCLIFHPPRLFMSYPLIIVHEKSVIPHSVFKLPRKKEKKKKYWYFVQGFKGNTFHVGWKERKSTLQTKLCSLEETQLPWSKLLTSCCVFPSHQILKANSYFCWPQVCKSPWALSNSDDTSLATTVLHTEFLPSISHIENLLLTSLKAEERWLRCTGYAVFWELCECPTGERGLCHQLLVSWGRYWQPKQFILI